VFNILCSYIRNFISATNDRWYYNLEERVRGIAEWEIIIWLFDIEIIIIIWDDYYYQYYVI